MNMSSIVDLVRKNYKVSVFMHVVIIVVCCIITSCHGNFKQPKFVPYKAKVISVSTDKTAHGGVYCQRVKLDNNFTILANAFSAEIKGQKTMLINYIAIGDSIVHNCLDTIYVYRKDADTYVFTHNKGNFK